MSDTVIRVENLSKRYIIGHQKQERYVALRDVIANGAKSLKQRIFHPMQKFEDPEHEDFWALQDVSFEIKQGDRVGIIGRNGAGKSTLLKILSRITEPTSGRVSIKGRVASLLEVGTGFHPELTGRENIFLNGAILGMGRAEIKKKFDEIVDFAEVEKFLDTPVKHYSSGMYVRLAFAVAAHLEPEILIVDEVLAVGDAQFQKKCLGKMEDVGKEGRTVLFVSHNMTTIQNLCSRIVLLQQGRVRALGDTSSTIQIYLSEGSISEGWDDLLGISQRSGEGKLKFSRMDFIDSLGNLIYSPLSGEKLIIRLHFSSFPEGTLYKNCRIGIGITNVSGINIVLSTEMTCSTEVNIRSRDFLDFCIDRLPLSQGTYSLTLFAESNGRIQDWLVEKIHFSVEGGDFYGTGKSCPIGYQGKSVLVNFSVTKESYQYA